MTALPTVSVVFLVYNRREELRTSLNHMLNESDYPSERVDVIVVDNASEDGSADMVREEFPDVRLVVREVNSGVSGWNDGFALVRGEYALVLDDDCYLPGDGLRRAVLAAGENRADLVSFGVSTHTDAEYRFNLEYRTGLLTFWGCAVLMRREVLETLGGYDPEIFVWANEMEFMVRFFDHGFRHLHEPGIVAVHLKEVGEHWAGYYSSRAYLINSRHFAYIAGKLFARRDAAEALVALLSRNVREAMRIDRRAAKALPHTVRGFFSGLRNRSPVSNPVVSRTYRRKFHSYASPWWLSRPVHQVLLGLPVELGRWLLRLPSRPEPPGRKAAYYAAREQYYPSSSATLQM